MKRQQHTDAKPVRQKHADYITQQLYPRGIRTAEQILVDAKRKASPLHELYNWNVQEAAEQHWLDRTRQIIMRVRMIVHTEYETLRVPMMVRDVDKPKNQQGYSLVTEIKEDPDKALRTLREELERVAAWLRRVRGLAATFGMEKELDDLIEQVLGLVKSAKGRAA